MAARTGYYKANSRPVPAFVWRTYAADGTHDDTLADGSVATADVLLVGVDGGIRTGVTVSQDPVTDAGTAVNEFSFSLA